MNIIIESFDKKIKEFESHKEYPWLKQEAEKAKRAYSGYGLEAIIYEDFIERIVAMPRDYILIIISELIRKSFMNHVDMK